MKASTLELPSRHFIRLLNIDCGMSLARRTGTMAADVGFAWDVEWKGIGRSGRARTQFGRQMSGDPNQPTQVRNEIPIKRHRPSLHLLARWYRRTTRQPIRQCIKAAAAEIASYSTRWER